MVLTPLYTPEIFGAIWTLAIGGVGVAIRLGAPIADDATIR